MDFTYNNDHWKKKTIFLREIETPCRANPRRAPNPLTLAWLIAIILKGLLPTTYRVREESEKGAERHQSRAHIYFVSLGQERE